MGRRDNEVKRNDYDDDDDDNTTTNNNNNNLNFAELNTNRPLGLGTHTDQSEERSNKQRN